MTREHQSPHQPESITPNYAEQLGLKDGEFLVKRNGKDGAPDRFETGWKVTDQFDDKGVNVVVIEKEEDGIAKVVTPEMLVSWQPSETENQAETEQDDSKLQTVLESLGEQEPDKVIRTAIEELSRQADAIIKEYESSKQSLVASTGESIEALAQKDRQISSQIELITGQIDLAHSTDNIPPHLIQSLVERAVQLRAQVMQRDEMLQDVRRAANNIQAGAETAGQDVLDRRSQFQNGLQPLFDRVAAQEDSSVLQEAEAAADEQRKKAERLFAAQEQLDALKVATIKSESENEEVLRWVSLLIRQLDEVAMNARRGGVDRDDIVTTYQYAQRITDATSEYSRAQSLLGQTAENLL